ncbi:MAG TPA: serine/threonine-protein kinase [Polyangiaceae bacterium]|jgi:serine/threonine-protein kinase
MGQPFQLGRYALHAELAAGGMAVVYLARQTGPVGFGKTVAVKRLHPHLARDSYFATMFLDEARLAARVQHPNVVPILDVVSSDSELFLVLEYVRGETLSGLLRAARKKDQKIPVPIAAGIVVGLLAGLHAAHEATDEQGKPLHIVHRDVSPQNLMVGGDGVPRVLDFGVAKAATRLQTTREGQLKGKIPYMSPEQLAGEVTARSDVYSAALVLWEALTRQRLFRGETEAQVLHLVMTMTAPAPSTINPDVPAALDAVVLKGLARDPKERYATAREMAVAIEACTPVASAMKIAEWVDALIGPTLSARDAIRAEIESGSHPMDPLGPPLSTPALPGFPQVADSSVSSLPSLASLGGQAGIAESTASLVVGTQAPARSRLPLVLGGLGVALVAVVAVAVGVAYGRSSPNVNASAPTASAPLATTPPPPSAPPQPQTPPPGPSAEVTTQVAPAVTHKHTVTKPPPPHATSSPSKNPNDIDTLLDTR